MSRPGQLKTVASLDDLGADPANANRGTDRGRAVVAESLIECGAGRSILADKDGTVIAGNKTLEAARKLGLPVRVIESTGEELVVVRRTDLDLHVDEKARRLAYLDDRAGQLGLDWDTEQMLEDLQRGVDLAGVFDDDEIKRLLDSVHGPMRQLITSQHVDQLTVRQWTQRADGQSVLPRTAPQILDNVRTLAVQ
jgi:hypothetical protein